MNFRNFQLLILFCINTTVLLIFYLFNVFDKTENIYDRNSQESNFKIIKLYNETKYSNFLLDLSTQRLNKLFDILHDKEERYMEILASLDLLIFDNIINKKKNDSVWKSIGQEKNLYLKVVDKRLRVTKKFIKYLYNLSNFYLAEKPEKKLNKTQKSHIRPIIVTASNSQYYGPLQATIYHLHTFLPENKIIVYDLGLTDYQYKTVIKIILIKFLLTFLFLY